MEKRIMKNGMKATDQTEKLHSLAGNIQSIGDQIRTMKVDPNVDKEAIRRWTLRREELEEERDYQERLEQEDIEGV